MKSPYNFIISPIGDNYNNKKNVDGKELILNTSLDLAKYVNRLAVVISNPIWYNGDIKEGDIVVVHHNVFRTYHDMKGRQAKSPEFFRDGLYIISPDRIYLYKSDSEWMSHLDYCFVKPIDRIQDSEFFSTDKEEEHVGIIVYPSSNQLKNTDIRAGSLVAFTKNSEYEFNIDDEKVYRMRDRDIVLKFNQNE